MNNRNINSNFELKAVSHEGNDFTHVSQINETDNIISKGKPSSRLTKQEQGAQYAEFKALWEKGYTEKAILISLGLKRNAPYLTHLTAVLIEGVVKPDDICICHSSEFSAALQKMFAISEGDFVELVKDNESWKIMEASSR